MQAKTKTYVPQILPPDYSLDKPTDRRDPQATWGIKYNNEIVAVHATELVAIASAWNMYTDTLKHEMVGKDLLLDACHKKITEANENITTLEMEKVNLNNKLTEAHTKMTALTAVQRSSAGVAPTPPAVKAAVNRATITVSKEAVDSGQIIINIIGNTV